MASVPSELPVFGDAGSYARALLDVVDHAAPAVADASFQLPSLRFDVASDDPGYLADCRRSLIDDPIYDMKLSVRVVVLSNVAGRGLPRIDPSVPASGMGRLLEQIEGVGLRGAHDFDRGIWQVYDPARRLGVQVALHGQYPPWEVSFPLRHFLHWAYDSLGMRVVHGATLGIGGIGVLLCGEGGAGKSGTTLGGMLNGLQSVGDDYVLIDLTGDRPRALPVMRLMKQDARGLQRLGFDLAGTNAVGPNWQDKYELDLGDQPPGSRVSELAIAAILLPRVVGGSHSSVRPATHREAMLALAPSTLRQLPGGMASGLSVMASLARRVPAYRLDLSSDASEIAATIRRVIGELPA